MLLKAWFLCECYLFRGISPKHICPNDSATIKIHEQDATNVALYQ